MLWSIPLEQWHRNVSSCAGQELKNLTPQLVTAPDVAKNLSNKLNRMLTLQEIISLLY